MNIGAIARQKLHDIAKLTTESVNQNFDRLTSDLVRLVGLLNTYKVDLGSADDVTGSISVATGGTGLSSYAIGDLIYADGTTSLAKLADVATGNVLISGGVGVAPSWGKTALTTHVSGDLPFANLTQGAALSVLGVTGNAIADVASIVAASDDQVLRRSGTALAFGAVNLAAAAAITGNLPDANLSANVPLLNGANTFSAAGNNFDEILAVDKGLQFPVTQVASAGANVLDDYEEGTWTPVIGGEGGTSGQTYTAQVGRYVKIGKLVVVQMVVALSAKGTITGAVQIQGLPFTAENTVNQTYSAFFAYQGMATTWVHLIGLLIANTSAFSVRGASAAATSDFTELATADIGNTTQLQSVLAYTTTA